MKPTRIIRSQVWRRVAKRFRRFWRKEDGFAAAEAALLTLIMCGMCLMVMGILKQPLINSTAQINGELAGQKKK